MPMNNQHKSNFKLAWLLSASMMGALVGCGNEQGEFGAIPVSGVQYKGDIAAEGTTDDQGLFQYTTDETLTFHIGDLELGAAISSDKLTVLDVTSDNEGTADNRVINKLILLYSIDQDGVLNNGIQISEQMSETISSFSDSIDFSLDTPTFTTQLASVVKALESDFTDTNPRARAMISAASAVELYQRATSERVTIKTADGKINGFAADDDTWQFLGVPYAKPPIGELRWKAPQKLDGWKGTRQAVAWSDQAAQNPALQRFGEGGMSEDSLYLNITAPKDAKKLPVMVWFHGGGFTALTSNTKPFNNPEALASKGVIQISVNHRLGPFGYIAHPELSGESGYEGSGNYGQLDLIAALEWVQKNIHKFGGDKNNVTIFGESGGGRKVLSLMASPLAKGLFHKAISQSGTLRVNTRTLEKAEEVGMQLQANLGAESLSEMREKTWLEIALAAGQLAATEQPYTNIDGYLIPESEQALFENNKNNDVPFMFLINTNDTPEPTNTVLNVFPWMAELCEADHFATLFDHQPSGWKARGVEAYHAAELAYLFNFKSSVVTHYALGLVIDPATGQSLEIGDINGNGYSADPQDIIISAGFNEADEQVIDNMMTMWSNFAKTGNPSIEGVISAPKYDGVTQQYIKVTDTLTTESNLSSNF